MGRRIAVLALVLIVAGLALYRPGLPGGYYYHGYHGPCRCVPAHPHLLRHR